ncbi:uncharacterized protein AruCF_1973 [Achromobacter ruhlandii]|nr:uncharacterized protein AruCF_1973 [Achromobacter ruhlandii]
MEIPATQRCSKWEQTSASPVPTSVPGKFCTELSTNSVDSFGGRPPLPLPRRAVTVPA